MANLLLTIDIGIFENLNFCCIHELIGFNLKHFTIVMYLHCRCFAGCF